MAILGSLIHSCVVESDLRMLRQNSFDRKTSISRDFCRKLGANMPRSDLLRSLAKLIAFLPMVMPIMVLGQEDQRGAPTAEPTHQRAEQSGEHRRHDSG